MYSNKIICEILDYIDKNIDINITIDLLTKKFYFNRYYIMKLFKKELHITIIEYIQIKKIFNSLKFFNTPNAQIINISILSNFNSLEYYSEIFKKHIGVSPNKYLKLIQRRFISQKDEELLRNNIIKIQYTLNNIKKYKENTKPETIMVKKLTIFK